MSAMSQDLLVDLFAPPAGALLFLAMTWAYGRALRGSSPLTPVMKGIMVYGSLFLLGMLYAVSVGTALSLRVIWIVLVSALWAVLLGGVAWRHTHRARATSPSTSTPTFTKAKFRQGFALVVLLVSLIASSIEWDYVVGHQGHWVAATLWTAGVTGSVLLAYGNRRETVIVALRAYLALAVIGAIAERSLPGIVLAACAGITLLIVQRFWKTPVPPIDDLKSLMNSEPSEPGHHESKTRLH